ncbi:hypothetical protein YTPLAS18_13200 [Nitrospira sp.]|nr:hypothetical protein YTPLAS18_13200 [Nitrospira sp.]
MRLIQRIAQDLRAGWVTLRQGAAEAATRALEETELVKLRLQLRKLDEQIAHVYEDIGERALARHEKRESIDQIMADSEMTTLVAQLQRLRQERDKVQSDIEDVRSGL